MKSSALPPSCGPCRQLRVFLNDANIVLLKLNRADQMYWIEKKGEAAVTF